MNTPERRTYNRRTVIAAADMLKALGHSGFDKFLLDLGDDMELISGRDQGGLEARATSLARFAVGNPVATTPNGTFIANEIVEKAKDVWAKGTTQNLVSNERNAFAAALEAEGTPLFNDPLAPESNATSRPVQMHAPWMPVRPSNLFNAPATTATETENPATPPLPELTNPLTPGVAGRDATVGSVPAADMWVEGSKEGLPRKIFIVHGHGKIENNVARFLEKINFEAIILHEQINKGQTIIEKFEHHADVPYAVVLVTPDDVGGKTQSDLRSRARQNVILEWGYFAGRLGRGKVCVVKVGDTELPSDLLGVAWYSYESDPWKTRLAQELENAGFSIDWAAVSRAT